jgi:DNA-binding transcriptional LysR family regulator
VSKEPDLRHLAAFATVARHRNFRRAAAELQMSPAALSENLRALEEQLGVRLLNRTTRSVAPTEAGERLLARLTPALRDVRDAVSNIQGERNVPAGRLRINAASPAVQHVLATMVGPFLERFPQIRLEIMDTSNLVDIVAEGFDAGVRYEENLARDMIALSLGPPQRYLLVASPKFLAAHGRPDKPEDVLERPCIVTRFPTGVLLPWEFEKKERKVKFVPDGRLVCMHTGLMLQAAIDGVGYLMTFEETTAEAVRSGQLEVVLEEWCPPFPGPLLYYPSRRQPPPALAAFIQFVTERRKKVASATRRPAGNRST